MSQVPSRAVIWWKTIRPATLPAGAAPVFVGAALASAAGGLDLIVSGAALLGALLLQIGCNLVNDYADFQRGADGDDRLGPARAAAQGWLSVAELKGGALFSLGAAVLIGLYLISVGGWPIAALGGASVLAAVAYTAGPYPLAYLGLGDLFVFIFFGLGAVVGTYFLQAQAAPPSVWAAGAAVGALATTILVVNNLRDREGDARAGKRTLAVRFGALGARLEYLVLLVTAYGLSVSQGWLAPLVTLPFALWLLRELWRREGAALNPLLKWSAQLELLFCICLSGELLWR